MDPTINQTTIHQASLMPWSCPLAANRSECLAGFRGRCDPTGRNRDRRCLRLGLLPHDGFVRYHHRNTSLYGVRRGVAAAAASAAGGAVLVFHPTTTTGRHGEKKKLLHESGVLFAREPDAQKRRRD